MEKDSNISLKKLRVDGGAVENDVLMQFQSDLLQVPVERPIVNETTALGSAYLAGLATGFWKDKDEISHHWNIENTFTSTMRSEEHTSELQSRGHLVCRLLLEKKKKTMTHNTIY